MPGIFFVFCALVTSVFSYVIAKTVLKKGSPHNPIAYSIISGLLGGLYAALFYTLTSFSIHDFVSLLMPQRAFFVCLDIALWALGSFLFYPAYKHLPVSESTILGTPEGLFAFFFGVILFKTETFQFSHLLGGLFILLSVISVSLGRKQWKWNRYTFWFSGSIAIYGMAIVVDNLIISQRYFSSPLFLQIGNFGFTAILMMLLYPQVLSKFSTILSHTRARFTVLATSAASVTSFFLIYNAYKRGVVASQANLILSSQTILVVIMGILVFKEKGSLKKRLLSAVIASIGVYLLS